MILKDRAIVLRLHPFGNTSRIVFWLSAEHGKLATLAKGSQRPGSLLLGQFDLFYTCEILFYAKEQRNLHVLKECFPLEPRPGFRSDWRACAAASYAAGLLDRAMPFGPAPAGLYGLLAETLDRLAGHSPGPAFLPRFELRLLRELGLAPGWDFCTQCRADLRTGAAARLDAMHGALRCEACAAGRGLPVSAAALAAIRRMHGPELPDSLPERVFREIRAVAGGLLEHHAEFPPASRELTFQILAVG